MDSNHFNAIILGTGLTESILAAALAKAGYSILQVDNSPHYGDSWASLSLAELVTWAEASPNASCSTPSAELLLIGQRFSLSLYPTLLKATGPCIEVLIRSKVAAYLQFGILNGVGSYQNGIKTEGEEKQSARIERVPASKSDVFNHPTLSLIEKRRLTKLLLFAVGEEELDQHLVILKDTTISFPTFISTAFSLSNELSNSLSYALTLCTSPNDLALPALTRLRSLLRSIGRFGPSPFLVGHYGGAGDLVGGFSRICAVWGGGQILGRPILPLDPPDSITDLNSDLSPSNSNPMSIKILLDGDESFPTTLTGDWIISANSHLSTLFPTSSSSNSTKPTFVCAIIILTSPIPFPPSADSTDVDLSDLPDSNLFIFEPGALRKELGTVTVLQVGSGTFSTPEGYFALYLQAAILEPHLCDKTSEALLEPYITSLLSLSPIPLSPSFTLFHSLSPDLPAPPVTSANFLIVPPISSWSRTAGLITSSDDAAIEAERLFWLIVGEKGKEEGVTFFPQDLQASSQDES